MIAPADIPTARLLLRPFVPADAPAVAELAGDREVASTTASIPHPYPRNLADAWIASLPAKLSAGTEVVFAVTLPAKRLPRRRPAGSARTGAGSRAAGRLIGAIGLILDGAHARAEMGYWIGKPFWGNGYATEAARALIAYGFDKLSLNRIYAYHMTRNPASGRVLEKAGMKLEGELRRHVLKWDRFEDIRLYGVLQSDHRSG